VEFAVKPREIVKIDKAVAAVCRYADAALHNMTAGDRAFHNFGDGLAVPPGRIVRVEILDAATSV
jgi:hypothetical protein